jgi:bifunctional non-homologous end joining protein LigD
VHAPLGGPIDTKRLARTVAERVAAERPDEVVAEMRRSARRGKVYVDWLQNDPTRQTVAPYSLRVLPSPTVAAPVRWEEVERAAAEDDPELLTFTAADVRGRIEREGDLFLALR